MNDDRTPRLAGRPAMQRRAVSVDPADLVHAEPLDPGTGIPLMLQPRSTVDLAEWVRASRNRVEQRLLAHGALLFRGFGVTSAADFERVARAFTEDLLDYIEGSSPRTMLTDKVYTSTEYPPEYSISLHNELSYAHRWPGKLFFFCQTPASRGGETPLADGRHILKLLPPPVLHRFASKGVRYLRTMHDGRGPGLSWPTVFETTDRTAIEAYCREGGIDADWLPDGWLRTSQVRPAVIRHPGTGEQVWFNQADQWHPSNLGADLDAAISSVSQPSEMPLYAEFGDGTPIDPADLDAVRRAADAASTSFPWAAGDVLVIDNTMVLHGRLPFSGPRRVLVSMGDTVRLDGIDVR